MLLVASFAVGAMIGSFLNVLTLRFMAAESFVRGRSHCPQCKYKLRFFDLIPIISFFVLGGKCRKCSKKISWQYPLVELATAISFVIVAASHLGQPANLVALNIWALGRDLVFTAGLVALFVFDAKWFVLPDQVTLPLLVFAFVTNWLLGYSPWSLFVGVAVGGGFYLALWLISKGRWIGSGDIRLGAALGAMAGWPLILGTLYVAYLIGGTIALALLVTGRKKLGSQLPMGTFLTVAGFFIVVCGYHIEQWLRLIGI